MSLRDLTDEQLAALRRIVTEWIDEGFTTPPYEDAYYDIFEMLGIEGKYLYDIRRPGLGEEA